MDEAGQLSDAALAAVIADCRSDFNAIAADAFEAVFKGWGAIGTSNAGAIGGGGLECDDCDCDDSCESDFNVLCSIGHSVTKGDGWLQATTDYTGWTGCQSICIGTEDSMKGCFIDHVEVDGVATSMNSGARWTGEAPWPCDGAIGHVTTNVPCNTEANTWLLWTGDVETPHVIKVFFSKEACED